MLQRRTKKFISVVSALVLFVSLVQSASASASAAAAGSSSPASGHWAEATLSNWVELGWMTGGVDGDLRPDDAVTRAEFASLINRSFGLGIVPASVTFTDLSVTDWAYGNVQTAVDQGYLTGYDDNTIRPHQPVTREEAAVMIARLLDLDLSAGNAQSFSDQAEIAEWSAGAVAAASEAGIFTGFPEGSFKPRATMTRAEAAVSLERALAASDLGTLYAKAGTYGPESGVEKMEGNVTISAADVTLRNLHISGDLLIAASVGEGDVYLNGVTVDGNVTVRGGGEHSVHLTDSIVVNIVVDKKTGAVRLVAQGKTTVREVELRSPSIVNTTGIAEGGGISVLRLSERLPASSRIELRGGFDNVNVEAKLIRIAVPEGSIGNLNVEQGASEVDIELAKEASILELVLNAAAKIVGEGQVEKAIVNADGASFDKAPQTVELGENLSEDAGITIGGEKKPASEVKTPAPSASSPGGEPQAGNPPSTENPSPGQPPEEEEPGGPDEEPGEPGEEVPGEVPGEEPGEKPNDPIRFGYSATVTAVTYETLKLESVNVYLTAGGQNVQPEEVKYADGQWIVVAGGEEYRVNVTDGSNKPIPFTKVEKTQGALNSITIVMNETFTGRKQLNVEFVPSSSDITTVVLQLDLPRGPIILRVEDKDKSVGLDGRDFTAVWIPSGRPDVVAAKLFLANSSQRYDIEALTPAAVFGVDQPWYTWTGEAATLDGNGNSIRAGDSYAILIAEYDANDRLVALQSKTIRPVTELNMDYNDPGPNPSKLPSPDSLIPNVMAASDPTLDLENQDRRYATVGDVVYGKSDMDGYLYLLPVQYANTKTVSYFETAVQNGVGLRVKTTANQWVPIDTRWLSVGSYYVMALSTDNRFSGDMHKSSIELFADESMPLRHRSIATSSLDDNVRFGFNKEIYAATGSLESLIKIKDLRTGTLYDVTAAHEVKIERHELSLNLEEWVTKGEFSVVIPAGALKDRFGHANADEIITHPYEFSPRLEIQSDDGVEGWSKRYKKDGKVTLTASKDIATLYLVEQGVSSSDPLTYELEVQAGRGKKLSLKAGVPAELSLAGLAPGGYNFRDAKRHVDYITIVGS